MKNLRNFVIAAVMMGVIGFANVSAHAGILVTRSDAPNSNEDQQTTNVSRTAPSDGILVTLAGILVTLLGEDETEPAGGIIVHD